MRISLERRATERFPLRLPITVRWTTPSGVAEVQTESRDVSSGGVYFSASKQIEDSTPVEIVMTLPNEITSVGRMHVCCIGRIKRTEIGKSNRVGVAAQIEHYQFLREGSDTRGLIAAKI